MKGLTKEQIAQREELSDTLDKTFTAVEQQYATLTDMIEDYNKAVIAHNAALAPLRDFISEITGDMESFMEEKSEKWQDSEAGAEYQAWKDAWDEFEVNDLDEMEVPGDPTDTEASAVPDTLKELPTRPG